MLSSLWKFVKHLPITVMAGLLIAIIYSLAIRLWIIVLLAM
jgi:hypothetical protein